jgi:hypothetical protein
MSGYEFELSQSGENMWYFLENIKLKINICSQYQELIFWLNLKRLLSQTIGVEKTFFFSIQTGICGNLDK